MVRLTLLTCLLLVCHLSFAQEKADTTLPGGKKASFQIKVVPCECDSATPDSIAISMMRDCFDTITYLVFHPTILDFADSVARAFGVPPKLVYEVGMNESRWPNIYDLNHLIKDGDLQVIDRTFNHFYKELGLTGGKTRKNYIIVGIYYLRYNYNIYNDWRKARYAYGRGRWKPESQWTSLERKFMSKIDWNQYR